MPFSDPAAPGGLTVGFAAAGSSQDRISEGGLGGSHKETLVDLVKREGGLDHGVLADPALRQRLAPVLGD